MVFHVWHNQRVYPLVMINPKDSWQNPQHFRKGHHQRIFGRRCQQPCGASETQTADCSRAGAVAVPGALEPWIDGFGLKTLEKRGKIWANHRKTIEKPWENHENIMGKSGKIWENHGDHHGKIMGKSWENHGKSWENHEKIMVKMWEHMSSCQNPLCIPVSLLLSVIAFWGSALSLYSVSCTSLTNMFLQNYNGLQPILTIIHIGKHGKFMRNHGEIMKNMGTHRKIWENHGKI